MINDITSFIPKYPNINKLESKVFNPYDEDFYETIYKKKELYDLKLEKIENVPDLPGQPLNHQELIARFVSSYTMYDELLLVHEMGTGKSCTAVRIAEQVKSDNFGITGALYIAKGDSSIDNFINELIFKCTDGRYIPELYESLTELEKTHRKK